MTSTVTNISNLIDTNFPVTGTSNNISGFHNNFSYIVDSLNATNNEIENLKNIGVFLTETLDFDGGTIENVTIEKSRIILNSI